ncbi:MAG: uracil-DNA glycosylase [Proteobacteria bacterium]|nr:uracil-DNA glycosylase [Pseudomonadota bacterium]MCL2307496.1 uracil-DNA glycosylase [Pseudomonadota bacterium]
MRRDEVLNALGLTVWRLRGADNPPPLPSLSPCPSPAVSGRGEAFPSPLPQEEREASPDTRAQRIAQLSWDDFVADVAACTACDLCKTRTKPVPGVGDVRARWLFVGEGPGAEEDKKGEPFVGQAGLLLDQMLAALGMKRGDDVYIANVLKCRPPNNRAPTPQEADACRPYLERQIALIQPKIIVALGKSAAMLLLNTDASIASLRGRVHRYRETPLVVTYHPAYLLRSPADKAKSWEDLVFTKKTLAAENA